MRHWEDAMQGPDWSWRWSPWGSDWSYVLGCYRDGQGWEFSGRGYGTSGYKTPIGAFVGWLRFYREAKRWQKLHREGV